MMRKLIVLLIVLTFITGCSTGELPVETSEPTVPTTTPVTTAEPEENCKGTGYDYDEENLKYNLVWSDEFDYEGLPDDTKWNYDVGGRGWGNRELQYYTDEGNAYVSDGYLTITAKLEEFGGNDYTSARMVTKNKGDWLYGKIEVSAKLPSGRGTPSACPHCRA